VRTEAKYIGMIGSRAKNKAVFSNLEKKGIPKELLENVHAPIGLNIGAETPEEIAVSILAEMIEVKRKEKPTGEKVCKA
jgi:xanthine dehydrogenase accessory factor